MTTAAILKPLSRHEIGLLTTYDTDGVHVEAMRVRFAVHEGRILLCVDSDCAAVERLREHSMVDLTPCSPGGQRTGSPIRARAQLLSNAEAQHASRILDRRHPSRLTAPLTHRLLGRRRAYVALTPVVDQEHPECAEGAPD
jgi:uncharacterized protein